MSRPSWKILDHSRRFTVLISDRQPWAKGVVPYWEGVCQEGFVKVVATNILRTSSRHTLLSWCLAKAGAAILAGSKPRVHGYPAIYGPQTKAHSRLLADLAPFCHVSPQSHRDRTNGICNNRKNRLPLTPRVPPVSR
jgi:hypothetical protein